MRGWHSRERVVSNLLAIKAGLPGPRRGPVLLLDKFWERFSNGYVSVQTMGAANEVIENNGSKQLKKIFMCMMLFFIQ